MDKKKGTMTEEKRQQAQGGVLYGHRKYISCLRIFENKYVTIH